MNPVKIETLPDRDQQKEHDEQPREDQHRHVGVPGASRRRGGKVREALLLGERHDQSGEPLRETDLTGLIREAVQDEAPDAVVEALAARAPTLIEVHESDFVTTPSGGWY